MHRPSTVFVPFALLALLLAGCGGQDAPAQATPPAAPPSSSSSAEDTSAADDVKITRCEQTSWAQKIDIEVTNSTDEPWRYVVGVAIKNAKGEKSEARFVKNRIEPGAKVAEQIPGDTPLKGEITCEIAEAKRMSPK